jgi:hypothetical protein
MSGLWQNWADIKYQVYFEDEAYLSSFLPEGFKEFKLKAKYYPNKRLAKDPKNWLNRILIVKSEEDALILVNHWNGMEPREWTYYIEF